MTPALAIAEAYAARSRCISKALADALSVKPGTVDRSRIDRLMALSQRIGKRWDAALRVCNEQHEAWEKAYFSRQNLQAGS